MSATNLGSQKIWIDYIHPITGSEFNQWKADIMKPGIYKGGLLFANSINPDTEVDIDTFTLLIKTATGELVKVGTSGPVTVSTVGGSPAENYPYLVCTFTWADVQDNWLDFSFTDSPSANAIVFGVAGFTGSDLDGSFTYTDKTYGLYDSDTGNAYIENDLLVKGDLTVEGDTATINTATLDVEDVNITVNKGGNDTSALGSGITIEGDTDGYLRASDTDVSKLEFKAPTGNELTLDIDATSIQTMSGNLNVEDDSNINQDVTTDASPTFNSLILTQSNPSIGGSILTVEGAATVNQDTTDDADVDFNSVTTPNDGIIIKDGVGDNTLTIGTQADLTGDITLTVEDTSIIDQDVTQDASVTFRSTDTAIGYIQVRNDTAGTLSAQTVIKAVSHNIGLDLTNVNVLTTLDDSPIGILTADILTGQVGNVCRFGPYTATGFDTTSATPGDKVFSTYTGALILSETKIPVGFVLTAASDGVIFIDVEASSNDVSTRTDLQVYNDSGVQIDLAKVVKATGHDAGNDVPTVDTISSLTDKPMGVVIANIANGTIGAVRRYGTLVYDTSSASGGDSVYSDATGGITLTDTGLKIGEVLTVAIGGYILIDIGYNEITLDKIQIKAKNDTGGFVEIYRIVTLAGYDDSEDLPLIEHLSGFGQYALGISSTSINDGDNAFILRYGILPSSGLDTTLSNINSTVYADSGGNLTLSTTPLRVGKILSVEVNSTLLIDIASASTTEVPDHKLYFSVSDLSNNILNINHGFDESFTEIQIFNNSNILIEPNEITIIDSQNIAIDLTSFAPAMIGTWLAVAYNPSSGKSGTFGIGELSSGVLTITHNNNLPQVDVLIWNNDGKKVHPNSITWIDANSVDVDLSGFGTIEGSWFYQVTDQVRTQYQTFVTGDLTSGGDVTITHNFDEEFSAVAIYNNTNTKVFPDSITITDSRTITVNLLSRYPITGEWTAVVTDHGGEVGAVADLHFVGEGVPTVLPVALGTDSIAIGDGASIDVNSNNAIAIGAGATIATAIQSIVIGYNAKTDGNYNISIGNDAYISNSTGGSVAIGKYAHSWDENTISIGSNTYSNADYSITLGNEATTGVVATINTTAVPIISKHRTLAGNNTAFNQNASSEAVLSTQEIDFETGQTLVGSATVFTGSATTVTITGGHSLIVGQPIVFVTDGALPTELTADQIYYVKTSATPALTVTDTKGGTAITFTSGAGTGNHDTNSLNVVEIDIPTGSTFYIDEVAVFINRSTADPETQADIRIHASNNPTDIVATTTTTGLTTLRKREVWNVSTSANTELGVAGGHTLELEINSAGASSGGTYFGRAYFKGILIED